MRSFGSELEAWVRRKIARVAVPALVQPHDAVKVALAELHPGLPAKESDRLRRTTPVLEWNVVHGRVIRDVRVLGDEDVREQLERRRPAGEVG